MHDTVYYYGDKLIAADEDKAFYYASVFDEAVSMYRTTICLASDYAIRFEKVSLQDELEADFSSQKKVSWYSSAITMAATQKMLAEQVYCHNAEIKYDHVYKDFDFGSELKVFTVACPVSITVKDNTGKQLAYISDDRIDIESGYEPYFNRIAVGNGYAKIAVIPADCSIFISGEDTGIMNTYVASFQNYKMEKYQAYENIEVTERTSGYFEQDAEGTCSLIINGQKQQETMQVLGDEIGDDTYEAINSVTNNNITITMNKFSYECYEGDSFTVKARIKVPDEYEYGSHKYIGYYAYFNKGNWEQVASWWIDGGEAIYPIKMSIHDWEEKGNNLFVISVFPADNFATGGALCDNIFFVHILDKESEDGEQDSVNGSSTDDDYSNIKYVKISLDADGGSCYPNTITRRYLDIYDDLPEPTKAGYTFAGWYLEKNGQGKKKVWNSTVMEKTDHTLYAYWTEDEKNNLTNEEIHYDKPSLDSAEISGIRAKYTYTGKKWTPSPTVRYANKVLQRDIDYTLVFKSNKKVGVATIIICAKGDYSGSKEVNFRIIPKGTALKKCKLKSKKLVIKWKKQSKQVTGYEIQYCKNKHFPPNIRNSKRIKGPFIKSATINHKTKGKIYVRIRTYKKVLTKRYHSPWSKVMCIRRQ